MTVVPLFCARFIKAAAHHGTPSSEEPVEVELKSKQNRWRIWASVSMSGSTIALNLSCVFTIGWWERPCRHAWLTVAALRCFPSSPVLRLFPRSACPSFRAPMRACSSINVKAPSGTRISVTESEVAKVEALIRQVVSPEDLGSDPVQYRRHAWILFHLHEQFRRAHGFCASESQRRTQSRQLRVHGAG